MPVAKLDRTTVKSLPLPSGKTVEFFWDTELRGYGVKIFLDAGGIIRRNFVVQFRINGRQRRRRIGDAAKINADAARKKALSWLGDVAKGVDPAPVAADQPEVLTFAKAVEQHLTLKRGELRAATFRVKALYLTHPKYFGALHKMPISKVTRSDVSSAIDKITEASGKPTASRARAHLSALFVWCLQRGHVEQNPVDGSANPATAPSRDRVLSDEELVAVWKSCGKDAFGAIVKLLVLTGARRSEIGALRWSWIDLERGTITIPGDIDDGGRFEGTKNGRPLKVPVITDLMREVIESVPRVGDGLFGAKGFTNWSRSSLDVALAEPWHLHDIRRSVATGMANLGIAPHVIEAALNHVSGAKKGVSGIYNRSDYAREVKTALSVWSDHIDAIVRGRKRKVVPLLRRPEAS